MTQLFGVLLALICVLFASPPVLAHHSFEAEFDGSKLLTFTGVLTKLEWQNPHGWFYLDVKDDKGAVTKWAFEIAAPNVLRRFDENTREYFLANQGRVMSVAEVRRRTGQTRRPPIRSSLWTAESWLWEASDIMAIWIPSRF